MSPEERVGQLFMVPFVGASAAGDADIAKLIVEHKIGSVALLAANQNFTNDETTPRQIADLSNQLQTLALANGPLPLLVAVDHEGDGYPYTRVTGGVTPIPSAMQIGATWDAGASLAVGEVVGRQLNAMGINMVLGPTLDVLNNPKPTGRGDVGVRSFGGDPYWVGVLGQAYIQGVHRGSNGRVATVAKHFPGHGGSDRLPDEEVATVDKSLQQLRRIELAPFFRVTDLEADTTPTEGVTDALMTSHIRYRGFQDDLRQFTGPISFDSESLQAVLGLTEFVHWRDRGGLMVSDALGVPAVRKYYDPTLSTFPHRRIAKDALLAGNELLILAQFDLKDRWPDQFANIKDTAGYFASEYKSNRSFAAKVDAAALRVIRLKLRLYPNPSPTAVLVDGSAALAAGLDGEDVVRDVAQRSLSRLYPAGSGMLPASPRSDEKILVISDVRQVRDCYDCRYFETLPMTAVQDTILRLYGPAGTGQVAPEQISSLSFEDVKRFLQEPLNAVAVEGGEQPAVPDGALPEGAPALADVANRVNEADWVIIASLDYNTVRFPESDALKLLLAQGGAALLDKYVVVLALNGPYYLDTTEISKLDEYLCTYSKIQPALEAGVRALFGEATANAAPPVTVEGIGYDLVLNLAPAGGQPLPVRLADDVPQPAFPPVTLEVAVGPILDENGHPVPDGTTVTFAAHLFDEPETAAVTAAGETVAGMTGASLTLLQSGEYQIVARAGDAMTRQSLRFMVAAPPTPTPTQTLTPTASPSPSATAERAPTQAVTPSVTAGPDAVFQPTPPAATPAMAAADAADVRQLNGLDLLLALVAMLLAVYVTTFVLPRPNGVAGWVRRGLLVLIGGLSAYLIYGLALLRLEDTLGMARTAGLLASAGFVFVAAVLAPILERAWMAGGRAGADN